MRKITTNKKASPGGAKGNANKVEAKDNTALKAIRPIARPARTPTGKGLGKAGAKRLGRLLKRAIPDQEPPKRGKVSLPKTPVRLFKHRIQTAAQNAPKTHTAKPSSPHVPQLILSLVSQCKHQGGISMADLKQALAAEGHDVTKTKRRTKVVTLLVNNETLVRTPGTAAFRLNNKTDTKQVRTSSVKSPNSKADLRQRKTASKSSEGAEKSQRWVKKPRKPAFILKAKTRKPKGKTPKPKGKSRKPAFILKAKTRKPAAKRTAKIRKPAAKSHKPRRKTPQARGKSPKPAGRKPRSATNQAAQVQKAPRAWRRQATQNRHPYKTSRRKQPPRRRPRLRTRQRRVPRTRAHYN